MSAHKLISAVIYSLILIFLGLRTGIAYAETTPYRSAGWVGADTVGTPYSNTIGCQTSNDGLYCSRVASSTGANLYFSSFGNLEEFGMPINSTINKLHMRVKGKSSGGHVLSITNEYNKISFSSSCQKPSDLITFFLGSADNTIEKNFVISSGNGLVNCITDDNINFRNLTFSIGRYLSNVWTADIDNFEIAFDYTLPLVTPSPVTFPANQKGTLWEIGPDKSNLSQKQELDNVVSGATGADFSMALKSDGTVWTWTKSDPSIKQVKGENGVGFLTDVKKVSAGSSFGMALKNDGSAWEWNQSGDDPQSPARIKYAGADILNVVDIAAGSRHKLVLKSDGRVYGWGLNTDGQVGIGCTGGNCSSVLNPTLIKNFTDVVSITAGGYHSLALKEDGTVWGWGAQSLGQLGEGLLDGSGNYSDRTFPVQLNDLSEIRSVSSKENYNLAINTSKQLIEWGENFSRRNPKPVSGLINIASISAGPSNFSFGVLGHAIREDGTLWQLYVNDIPPKQVPHLKDVVDVASGDQTPSLAVINSPGDVLGDSTVLKPFLDLPWAYGDGNFEKQVFNPESWFDHRYPLQNIPCCTQKVLQYTGREGDVAYRSHSGYDYALRNGVGYRTPVLAAASGSAEFKPAGKTGGLGNTIKINHGNGYQTWYGHLDAQGLISIDESVTVQVEKGQKIGETGFTGNIYPPNQFGAHIHFSVFKDINNNGNFDDDYPYGLVDPLGWEGDSKDPWTEYGNEDGRGAESIQLFANFPKPTQQFIPRAGGEAEHKNLKVKFDPDSLPLDFTIHVKDGPYEYFTKDNKDYQSVGPSFFLNAFSILGDKLTQFFKPVYIIYSYQDITLENIKEDTLKIYYFNIENLQWEPLPSTVDLENNIILTQSSHFSQFAVMGEIKDKSAPVTESILSGDKLAKDWFRSSVKTELIAEDNVERAELIKTLYSVNDGSWNNYSEPLLFSDEGKYKISFQSSDKFGNIENIKSKEFNIDKTLPNSVVKITGAEGLEGWYMSNVSIELSAEDFSSGIHKKEYSTDNGLTYQQYNEQIVIDEEGISGILYRAIDNAGNQEESKKLTIKVDKTDPSTGTYFSGMKGKDEWFRSNVSLEFYAKDLGSGIGKTFYSIGDEEIIEYTGPILLTDEGSSIVYYYSLDKAGNKEKEKSIEIKIDKTSPSVSISAKPEFIWPPNGKMIEVMITGSSKDDNLLESKFIVDDEYNSVEPLLTNFNQIIKLEAKRNGNDIDGRLYTIKAAAEDVAGNISHKETKVIVPHNRTN